MGASKHLRGTRIVLAIAAATTVIATAAPFASADPIASASGSAFTALQPPFTEETFATSGSFLGGVAFAPNGDVWADECASSGSSLQLLCDFDH